MLLQDNAAGASALVPNVGACRTINNADIVGVPLDGVHGELRPFSLFVHSADV